MLNANYTIRKLIEITTQKDQCSVLNFSLRENDPETVYKIVKYQGDNLQFTILARGADYNTTPVRGK